MPGCAAPNCSNHNRKGGRFFKFPSSPRRRAKWVQNCRRDKWTPGKYGALCQGHFEDSQYETAVVDENGKRKLRKTAIPTIFDVPNPPKRFRGNRPVSSLVGKQQVVDRTADSAVAGLVDHMVDHNYAFAPSVSLLDASAETETSHLDLAKGSTAAQPDVLTLEHSPPLQNNFAEQETSVDDEVCENYEKSLIAKQQRRIWQLEKKMAGLIKENKKLKSDLEQKHLPLPFLTKEQEEMLFSGKRTKVWSPESIKDAIQLRFAVGWKGYKYLIQKGFPLPSYSTICRRLNTIDFSPGLLTDVLHYMKTKAKTCSPKERDCVLLLDEMDIAKGLELYPGMTSYVGNCTLGSVHEQETQASQLLVVMLRGLNSSWKQVVGYHFLSKKCSANTLSNFVKKVLTEVEATGYRVLGVVSDMGPKNQGIWRDLGLCVGKFSKTSQIKHPVRKNEDLFFFADVPHLIKNLKQALLVHKFTLPPDVVENNNLPYNEVDVKYLRQLVELQKDQKLKLACNLTPRHLDPNQFEKMKVSMATQVFSERTAAALETVVQLGLVSKKALSTAWFLRTVREWFDILNGRNRKNSITRKNSRKKISKLQAMITLITNVKIGDAGHWKPIQTGIVLSTTNMILLKRKLFAEGYGFFMTSRCTQDALESLFSVLRRHGNQHPSALQAAQALKLITISHFVGKHGEKSGNYDLDNDRHYVEMFSTNDRRPKDIDIEECCESMKDPDLETSGQSSVLETNAMNTLLGGAIKSVLGRNTVCPRCVSLICQEGSSGRSEEVALTLYDKGRLVHPSRPLYDTIRESEQYLVFHLIQCVNHKSLLQHIVFKIKESVDTQHLNTCKCKVGDAVLVQYVRTRLSINATEKKEQAKQSNRKAFGSKSAYMVCIRE